MPDIAASQIRQPLALLSSRLESDRFGTACSRYAASTSTPSRRITPSVMEHLPQTPDTL